MTVFLSARRKKIIDARQYAILRMRWKEHKSLVECASAYGVGAERVRQIEAKAFGKIRRAVILGTFDDNIT